MLVGAKLEKKEVKQPIQTQTYGAMRHAQTERKRMSAPPHPPKRGETR